MIFLKREELKGRRAVVIWTGVIDKEMSEFW